MNFISKILFRITSLFPIKKEWKEIEYFDSKWENRVKKMAGFILPFESIMDIGCGQMSLKKFLTTNKYIPVDYKKRDDETIICDFNKYEFPKINADVAFISGCLEYIHDYRWLANKVCHSCNKVILSYCAIEEFPSLNERRKNYWVNHLSFDSIISLFKENGFELSKSTNLDTKDRIMVFTKL